MSFSSTAGTDILVFFAALLLSAVLTPAIRDFAHRRELLDDSRSVRKIHTRSIPRLGGVAFVGAWLLIVAFILAVDPSMRAALLHRSPRSLTFALGAVAAAAVGFVDDVRGLRARYKLMAQVAIGLLLCAGGFTVHEIQLPGDVVVPLGRFAVPLTVLWIAGVMNAMNLVDGLDGLAGGVSVIALTATFIFGVAQGNLLLALYSAALAGALLGFLVYNFNPASIFMGDTGSLFLGYFLSVAVVVPAQQPSTSVLRLALPLVILGVPIADMLLAIARRMVRGRKVFSPDREHLPHRLLERGMTQREAVITLYCACAILAAGGVAMKFGGPFLEIMICGGLACAAISGLRLLGFFQLELKKLRDERRRNVALRTAMGRIKFQLAHVPTLARVIESIHDLGPAVSASAVTARIGGTRSETRYEEAGATEFKAAFLLSRGKSSLGDVVVAWNDGRQTLDADHALAIEELCDIVARAVRRVSPDIVGLRAIPGELPAVRRTAS